MKRDLAFFLKVSNLQSCEDIQYEKVKTFISKIHEAPTHNSNHIKYFEKSYIPLKTREDIVHHEQIEHIPFNDEHFVVAHKEDIYD